MYYLVPMQYLCNARAGAKPHYKPLCIMAPRLQEGFAVMPRYSQRPV